MIWMIHLWVSSFRIWFQNLETLAVAGDLYFGGIHALIFLIPIEIMWMSWVLISSDNSIMDFLKSN